MTRTFLALVASVLILAGCGNLTTWDSDLVSSGLPDRRPLAEQVDTIASSVVRDGQAPGLEVGLLLPDGTTRFFGYGTTGAGGGHTPGPDTLFAVGSLSKGFLAAITSTLVQQGRLSWSDKLSTLLPPETPLSADAAAISVDQLVTHTSGLPRQPDTLKTLTYFIQYLFTGDNFYRHLDADAMLGYLANFDTPSDPQPEYSNIGYSILDFILERRTGQSIDSLLAERIAGPLGLDHTGFSPEDLPGYDARARGHAGDQPKFVRRGHPVPDWRMTNIMRGPAALYSTARDLLKFASAHLHPDDSPLNRALADNLRIRVPRPHDAAAAAWFADDIGTVHIVYQVGTIAGYTSYLAVNEANRTAVVVLQNAFNWDYTPGHRLMLLLASPKNWQD